MVGLASFILIGLIVATIAKAVMPGRDPGAGITLLLGTTAQIIAWFITRATGWDKLGQPWLFFLSIAVAAVLLFGYRDSGLDEILRARRPSDVASPPPPARLDRPATTESRMARLLLVPAWAAAGAVMLGVTGFVIGFFGPIRYQPWANQGPMLGIFVTGPGGVLLGAIIGGAVKFARPEWPTRWNLWTLNAATVAYGLFVLELVVDRSWWR